MADVSIPLLTDSHAHLDREEYDTDRGAMLARAVSEGVGTIINIALGPELDHFERAHQLVMETKQPAMYLAIGVHPHDANKMTGETIPLLRSFSSRDRVVAIGEIGLDYYYDHSARDIQQRRFQELLDLALELKLPVSIHSRDAFEDTYRLTSERDIFRKIGGVLHCFTGTASEAKKLIDLGAYISFSGIVTFKKAVNVHEAVKVVPMDRILIETDAPFLTPEPHRGKRNEPAFVSKVADKIAELKNLPRDDVVRAISENAARLFHFS